MLGESEMNKSRGSRAWGALLRFGAISMAVCAVAVISIVGKLVAEESCSAKAESIKDSIEKVLAAKKDVRRQGDDNTLWDSPCAPPGTKTKTTFTLVIEGQGGPAAGGNSWVKMQNSLQTEYQHAFGGNVSDRAFFCADGRVYYQRQSSKEGVPGKPLTQCR